MQILSLTPELAPHFDRINRPWIEEFFTVEPQDDAMLTRPEKIVEGGGAVLFAEIDGAIVGTGALFNLGDGLGEIVKMGVNPAFQGKGIGRAILEALIGEARKAHFHTLRLESSTKLPSALHLYRKLGFTPICGVTSPHGYTRCDIFMELKLGEESNE